MVKKRTGYQADSVATPNDFRRRFTFALVIYAIIILALWFAYYQINQTAINRRDMENTLITADNLKEQVRDEFERMRTIAVTIAGSGYVQDFLKERDVHAFYAKADTIAEIIQRAAFPASSADSVITVNTSGDFYRFSGALSNSACEKLFETFQDAGSVYTVVELDGSMYFCHNSPVFDSSGPVPLRVGNVILLTGLNKARRLLDSGNAMNYMDAAIMLDDTVILSGNHSIERMTADELMESYYAVTSIEISGTPLTIVAAIPKEAVYPDDGIFLSMALMLLCLLISMILILYRYLSGYMMRPMADIMARVRGISSGMSDRLPKTGKSDFDALVYDINDMLDRTERYSAELLSEREKLFDAELSKQKMRMGLLTSQMDAHFVVNTLTGIKNLSDIGENGKAGQMAEGLAIMLRYRHTGKTLVNVFEELAALEKYISIMNIRYEGRFICENDVEEALAECLMPGFVLQPIVENAMLHGLRQETQNARLLIRGRIHEDKIYFDVNDNGAGIPPDKLKRIRDNLDNIEIGDFPEPGLRGVALENIQRRIRLQLGGQYGIQIDSVQGSGTTVAVTLPLIPDR